ncbi:MAG: hypothetical protein PHV18_05025 [Lachnospiraceae bacterium]|nr:hypothetical protein [Lachnospiraceae bacterium]
MHTRTHQRALLLRLEGVTPGAEAEPCIGGIAEKMKESNMDQPEMRMVGMEHIDQGLLLRLPEQTVPVPAVVVAELTPTMEENITHIIMLVLADLAM